MRSIDRGEHCYSIGDATIDNRMACVQSSLRVRDDVNFLIQPLNLIGQLARANIDGIREVNGGRADIETVGLQMRSNSFEVVQIIIVGNCAGIHEDFAQDIEARNAVGQDNIGNRIHLCNS